MRVVPRASLPASFEKLLNGRPLHYVETTVFDPTTRSASFDVESAAGRDRAGHRRGPVHRGVRGDAPPLRGRSARQGVRPRGARRAIHRGRGQRSLRRRSRSLLQQFIDDGRAASVTPLSNRPPEPVGESGGCRRTENPPGEGPLLGGAPRWGLLRPLLRERRQRRHLGDVLGRFAGDEHHHARVVRRVAPRARATRRPAPALYRGPRACARSASRSRPQSLDRKLVTFAQDGSPRGRAT